MSKIIIFAKSVPIAIYRRFIIRLAMHFDIVIITEHKNLSNKTVDKNNILYCSCDDYPIEENDIIFFLKKTKTEENLIKEYVLQQNKKIFLLEDYEMFYQAVNEYYFYPSKKILLKNFIDGRTVQETTYSIIKEGCFYGTVGLPLFDIASEENFAAKEDIFAGNTSFNSDKKTVFYPRAGYLRDKEVNNTLVNLSASYTVMTFNQRDYPVLLKTAENTVPVHSQIKDIDLLYYGADYILAPIASSYLIYAVMLKKRVIPVFTRYIDLQNDYCFPHKKKYENRFVSFIRLLKMDYIANEILKYIVPVDIEDSHYVKYLLNNSVYWNKYDKMIQEVSQLLFGDVVIKGSFALFVNAIKQIMKTGTIDSPRKVI